MRTLHKKPSAPISDPHISSGRVAGLPKDFFETVLDCEVKLKEKFDMKVLQKLIDYYSLAVGYYESINDPKFMIYNQSLNLLFSQPEVKQYLSGGNLKLKLKKENLQKIINDCDKKITTEKVQNFIKDPYVLEFLDIKDRRFLERDLESNLLQHISEFLLELDFGELSI